MAHYELNDENHRIELYFDDEFPDEEVRTRMKTAATDSSIMNRRCCYSNTLESFFKETESSWLATMKSAFYLDWLRIAILV